MVIRTLCLSCFFMHVSFASVSSETAYSTSKIVFFVFSFPNDGWQGWWSQKSLKIAVLMPWKPLRLYTGRLTNQCTNASSTALKWAFWLFFPLRCACLHCSKGGWAHRGSQEQLPCSCSLIKDISAGVVVNQSWDDLTQTTKPALPPESSRCIWGGGRAGFLILGGSGC